MDYETKKINNDKISRLMSTEVKSMVAKLLARENITIQRGNFETASFNLKTRILELPLWENINNDVLDLFIGHEISHALNTPADGSELFAAKCKGIPFSVCNIIEDIRIEKLVQKEYPGLISSFKAGYKYLYDNDFFRLGEIPMADRTLIDRINIKAKLGSLVEVPFEDHEMELVNIAFNCKSYDDVLDAVNLFKEKLGEVENDEPTNSDGESDTSELTDEEKDALSEMGDDSSSDESGSGMGDWMAPEDDGDKTNSDQDGDGESTTDEDSEEKTEGSNATGTDDGWEDDGTEAETVESKTPVKSAGQYGSHSQDALNDSLNGDRLDKDMDESDISHYNFIAPTNEQIEDSIVPYSKIKESRLESSEFIESMNSIRGDWHNNYEPKDTLEEFRKFNATSKKFVNNLKMEFEMKKSAYQYTRATISKTGKLDVNALHAYKYSEDIFNSVTTLADAKSHGMIFLIDMSGSMHHQIGTIYKQAINLSMFCKAVGIPFKVYGFTSNYYNQVKREEYELQTGQVDMSGLHMTELLSSDLKKSAWKEALFHMFVGSEMFDTRGEPSRMEQMGGTPLGLASIALMKKVKEFQAKHKIEKTSIMYLTDGSGSRLDVHARYGGSGIGKLNGKIIKLDRHASDSCLVNHLKKTTGATLTHFFLVSNKYDTRQAGYPSLSNDEWKDIRKTKIITRDSAGGFDRVFIIKEERVNLTDENNFSDVETDGMKDHQLLNAFKKNQKSRKNDRIFVNKFMEMVA
jgi:hypothetical protein